MGSAEPREQAGNVDAAAGKQRPDRDPAPGHAAQLVDLLAHSVDLGQHPAGPRGDRLPGLGRGHPPAGPLEELGAELRLEAPDLMRERRLRHVQLLGGTGEVPMACDGLDISELAQLHASIHLENTIDPLTTTCCPDRCSRP